MNTFPRVLALAFLALALPAGAAAKELSSATVCGADACHAVDDPPIVLVEAGDGIPDAAPELVRFYTVRLVAIDGDGTDHAWTVLWVPSAGMVGFVGETGKTVFENVAAAPAAAFGKLTASVTPYAPVDSWADAFTPDRADGGGTSWLWWAALATAAGLLLAALLWVTRSRRRESPGSTPRPATPR